MAARKSTHGWRYGAIGSFAVLLSSTVACGEMLGIEEARIDPSIAAQPPGEDGNTGGGAGGVSTDAGGDTHAGHSGGSTPGDGSVTTTDGSGDGETISPVCKGYCDDIMTFCVDAVKQYVDVRQCQKMCALFPEGTVTDPDANTASCRLRYAGKARYALGSERDTYCRSAGPGSDGRCGTICDGFCTLVMATCTSQTTPPYFFSSATQCLSVCRALRDAPPYTVSDGELPDRNDAQCRLFHVASAVMDPDEHCEHAMGVTMCDRKFDGGD